MLSHILYRKEGGHGMDKWDYCVVVETHFIVKKGMTIRSDTSLTT
jgi:hypothetical protein